MAEKEKVEVFLHDNPEFLQDFVIKNISPLSIEEWHNLAKPQIEASESGPRNSITQNMFRDMMEGRTSRVKSKRMSKEQLLEMSEKELFMELIRDIANELDVDTLCHKILLNVSVLTKSDRGSLFLVRGSKSKKYLVSKLFDVTEDSVLEEVIHTPENEIRVPFGVGIAGSVAESKDTINIKDAYEDSRFNKEVDIKTGYRTKSLLCMPILNYEGTVIGVAQIMNKIDGNDQFTPEDEELFKNYLTFCGIGLTNAQLFELSVQEYKRNQLLLTLARGIFAEQDSMDGLVHKIMSEAQELLKCERCTIYLLEEDDDEYGDSYNYIYSGPIGQPIGEKLRQSSAKYRKGEDKELHEKHHGALKTLSMMKAKMSVKKSADDVEFSKAYELHVFDKPDEDEATSEVKVLSNADLKKAKNKCTHLAKDVVAHARPLNIPDTIADPKYGVEIEDDDGFKIRSLLMVPIFDANHVVVGVVRLANKINKKPFNSNDVNIVEAFAIFCGLGIHNCQMYENACKLMAKQNVALEVLSFHATAPQEDVDKLKSTTIPCASDFKIYTWEFDDRPMSEDETCQAVLRICMEMDIFSKFHVPYEVMCRWTLSVRKNYRPVTYHNWRHGFNVAQTMFTMVYSGGMKKYLNDLQVFGLIVACLCHDLDHRGTNNAFQSKSESPLAVLYGTSTMEHHHFDQCIQILNSKGNNIFVHLDTDDYREMIKCIENAILSTDLALYFKKKGAFKTLVDDNTAFADWLKPANNELMRAMMMTACDVAAITKPWEIQREVAQLVAAEFFEQGDLERSNLEQEPIPMMDREKKGELPKMQVGFIDFICVPCYKTLAEMDQGLQPLYDGLMNNRNEWQKLADEFKAMQEAQSKAETPAAGTNNSSNPTAPAATNGPSGGAANSAGPADQTSTGCQICSKLCSRGGGQGSSKLCTLI